MREEFFGRRNRDGPPEPSGQLATILTGEDLLPLLGGYGELPGFEDFEDANGLTLGLALGQPLGLRQSSWTRGSAAS